MTLFNCVRRDLLRYVRSNDLLNFISDGANYIINIENSYEFNVSMYVRDFHDIHYDYHNYFKIIYYVYVFGPIGTDVVEYICYVIVIQ